MRFRLRILRSLPTIRTEKSPWRWLFEVGNRQRHSVSPLHLTDVFSPDSLKTSRHAKSAPVPGPVIDCFSQSSHCGRAAQPRATEYAVQGVDTVISVLIGQHTC